MRKAARPPEGTFNFKPNLLSLAVAAATGLMAAQAGAQ